jgi:Mce-associated membrane protein
MREQDDRAEPGHTSRSPHPEPLGRRRQTVAAILGIALLVFVAIAVVGFIGPQAPGDDREEQRRDIQAATSDAVSALMTFTPQTLADQQQTVGPRLTGRLLLDFRSRGPAVVLPAAVDLGAQMSAEVVATAVNRMDSDSALVLVFVNQDITVPTADPARQVVAVSRWADMRKVDDNWLLAGLQPVGPG